MYITERFAVGVCFDVDLPQVLACFGDGKLNCSFKNIKHVRLGIGGKERIRGIKLSVEHINNKLHQ